MRSKRFWRDIYSRLSSTVRSLFFFLSFFCCLVESRSNDNIFLCRIPFIAIFQASFAATLLLSRGEISFRESHRFPAFKEERKWRFVITRAKCKTRWWLASTEKGNWPASGLIGTHRGFVLKIMPRREFARCIAAKYRFCDYEWKNAREFLGRRPRGLLGWRPQTFGRLLKPASHRTSSRSKRNSYIRRVASRRAMK